MFDTLNHNVLSFKVNNKLWWYLEDYQETHDANDVAGEK